MWQIAIEHWLLVFPFSPNNINIPQEHVVWPSIEARMVFYLDTRNKPGRSVSSSNHSGFYFCSLKIYFFPAILLCSVRVCFPLFFLYIFPLIHTPWHNLLSTFISWPETLKQFVEIRNNWFMDLFLCLLNVKYDSPFTNIFGRVNHEIDGHQLEEVRRCWLSIILKTRAANTLQLLTLSAIYFLLMFMMNL